MAVTTDPTRITDPGVVDDLPLLRVNLLRVGYGVLGVGLAVVVWPEIIGYDHTMALSEGVVAVFLTAMSLLALLGLRHPVRLLPILLFEIVWKLIWLSVVAVPAVVAGDVDRAMGQMIFDCSLVVVIIAVVPWRYVRAHYVAAKGDPWRGAAG